MPSGRRASVAFAATRAKESWDEREAVVPGLLNAIAVGERGGEELFEAWACATPNDDVRAVLDHRRAARGRARPAVRQADQRARLLGDPQGGPGLPSRVALASAPT